MGLLTPSLFVDEKTKSQRSEVLVQGLLTSSSSRTVGELELSPLVPDLLSCRSPREVLPFVVSQSPGYHKDDPGVFPSSSFRLVLEPDWSQNC